LQNGESKIPDRFSLEGRVGFITGAARGLGQAMALGLAEHGAFVALNDLDADALTQTVQRFADDGLKAEGMAFDVADLNACRVAIADVIAEHGSLDILISNAGAGLFNNLVGALNNGGTLELKAGSTFYNPEQ